MAVRDLEVDIFEFLQRIQLEQFFEKIEKTLHLTRMSHFDHVTESDLSDINMSKPEQRRLLDAVKKYKKERKKASKIRFSLRKSKKKDSSNSSDAGTVKPQTKSCLVNESSIKILGELGDGAFGVVSQGEWTPNKGSKVPVAVKCLKFSNKEAFMKEQDNFMREASAMSDLNHPNVLHLYGIVLATPIKLVMELAILGSLRDRLRKEPQKFLITTIFDFVSQIASGMSYLESKRYVHRDLAARNIMLASYDKVKIGDFGLMRLLPTENDIYVMNPTGKIAVAWCAPECLKNREFSHGSDVWAFGITVIEMFSYGKQPWEGLNGSQILEIIDEPANGRPGKPDHCPDKLYSLLIEHCWDPNPKDRSKFSSIQDKLKELVPQDVTSFFDFENDKNPDTLVAKSGDLITIITWKSRLGTEFAKGQNKRTTQVGYFPISQVTRNNLKSKGSISRSRIPKVKDISPPLIHSFSHCAHRGNGETPNWGTVMSEERQVLGKHRPLNLPTKLISLNNSDGESQIGNSGELDSCSLISRDSFNYSSSLSIGQRSCADSGYYSNRDTYMSTEYELMTGSHPIAIPGINLHGRQTSPGIDHPATFVPPQHYTRRPSGASFQFDTYGQRCRVDSSGSDVSTRPEVRPVLPAKTGVLGNNGSIKPPRSMSIHDNRIFQENLYQNINKMAGTNHESLQRLSHVPEGPLISSSSESMYVNQQNVNNQESLSFVNIDYPVIYDRPSKEIGCQMNARCYSFPEVDMKSLRSKFSENEKNRNSLSLEKEIALHALNESKSAPILKREIESEPNSTNWESRSADEATSEEIYENIEIYNVPQALFPQIPPPLPVKRINSEKRVSVHRNSGSHDLDISTTPEQVSEEYYSRPVSQDIPSNFDSHLYAEISDKFVKELNLDGENDRSLEEIERYKDSFVEISKDYADLDAICAKLRENDTTDTQLQEDGDEARDKLGSVVEYKRKISKNDDVLWKRLSTDQRRIRQHTRRDKRPSLSDDDFQKHKEESSSRSVSNNSLKHSCSDLESVQTLHTCTTLVTTV